MKASFLPHWLKRLLLIVVIIIVGLPILGLIYQAVASQIDAWRFPPPGQMVDMGGYKLHLYCQGNAGNTPTIVMDAGLGSHSLFWSLVTPELTSEMRVCAFDRAGMGWSDTGPQSPSTADRNAELHLLLQKAGISPPYIMVGHSMGGTYAYAYLQHYPDKVAGLVLVDPGDNGAGRFENWLATQSIPADARQRIQPFAQQATQSDTRSLKMLSALTFLGVPRLAYGLLDQTPATFPNNLRTVQKALQLRRDYLSAGAKEMESNSEIYAGTYGQTTDCGNKPVIVLFSKFPTDSSNPDEALYLDYNWRFRMAQVEKLAACSTQGQSRLVEGSGHYIQLDKPDTVISAIRQVVKGAAKGQ